MNVLQFTQVPSQSLSLSLPLPLSLSLPES